MTNCQMCGQIIITVRVQNGESSYQAGVVRTAFRETETLKMNRNLTKERQEKGILGKNQKMKRIRGTIKE